MFLAIINDTYSEVKAEVNARKEAFQVSLEKLQLIPIVSFVGLFVLGPMQPI